MKEAFNQKMLENKPVLELKNTKEKVYQNSYLKKKYSHCALLMMLLHAANYTKQHDPVSQLLRHSRHGNFALWM